ncbi:MAG TPA: hypothetical protein DD426_02015 [Clostridiaceae bacterium]|nr:hypothetical protein [Clostridiaceae bacterium]
MKSINELELPSNGQTVIIKEIFGKKKIRRTECIVKGIYPNFIVVEHVDSKVRESFMKVDFFTGILKFEKCS